jgi:hypothetical protein
MCRAAIAALLMTAVMNSAVAQAVPTAGPNCALGSPPADAGEDISLGKTPMKFFPRAKDIPPNYTGCQKAWSVFRNNWISLSTRYFENGEMKVFLGPLIDGQDQAHCFFAKGKRLASSTRGCPSYEDARTPALSLPAGCIAELQSNSPSDRCKRYE